MPETYTPNSTSPPNTYVMPNDNETAAADGADGIKTKILKPFADGIRWAKDQITALLAAQKTQAIQAWGRVTVDNAGNIIVFDSYGMDAAGPVVWFNDRFEFRLASVMASTDYGLSLQIVNGGSVDGRRFEELEPGKATNLCRAWLIASNGTQVTGAQAPQLQFSFLIFGRRP